MIRPLLTAALLLAGVRQVAVASIFLPSHPYGSYELSALPLSVGDTLTPDSPISLRSDEPSGASMAAVEFNVLARRAHLAAWTGAKATAGGPAHAVAAANAAVVALPDEGEAIGQPVSLFVHLVARTYGGEAVYQLDGIAHQLLVEARVRPNASQPWQSLTGPGVLPISSVIGKQIELELTVHALAGEQLDSGFDSYAALDVQLYLSYDSNPPADLPIKPVIPADATMDGFVDGADYTAWADHYLQSTDMGAAAGDFNGDGVTDGGDYTLWADGYSPESSQFATAAVPEPTSLGLAAVGVGIVAGFLKNRSGPKIYRHPANRG